jgi:hypothetical protein
MDAKRSMLVAGLVLAVAVGVALAATQPIIGTVTGQKETGVLYSDTGGAKAILVDVAGKERMLKSFLDDATILVLTDKPCMGADTDVVEASRILPNDVAMIEVSTTHEGCDAQKQCAIGRGEKGRYLVSLCDPKGMIRQFYGARVPNAALVLDENGDLRYAGTLKEFGALAAKAKELAEQARKDRASREAEFDPTRGH